MSGTPWITVSATLLVGMVGGIGYISYIESVENQAKAAFKLNPLDANAFAHAYASAHLVSMLGSDASKYLGDFNEDYGKILKSQNSDSSLRWDKYKDMYNNEVGRQIARYLGSDWSRGDIELMIIDALKRGDLISTHEDSRTQKDFSGKVADFDNSIPVWKGPGGHWTSQNGVYTYKHIAQCFALGTKILTATGAEFPIEQLEVGDHVLAFDPKDLGGSGALFKKKIVKNFTNVTDVFIDLRGLVCTPGHMFLEYDIEDQSQGKFKSIAGILKSDGCIIDKNRTPCRARTGSLIGAIEDTPIYIIFRDRHSDVEKIVCARAGIPVPTTSFDSPLNAEATSFRPLIDLVASFGIEIDRNGRFASHDGSKFDFIDWPARTTPFDCIESQNWIVSDDAKNAYVPPRIADLPEVDNRSGMHASMA